MSIHSDVLNVHLQENRLSGKANEFTATVVPPGGTRVQEDLVRDIFDLRTEFDATAIDRLATLVEERIASYVLSGYSYKGSFFHYSPSVRGSWSGSTAVFDPLVHRVVVNVSPTVRLRDLLSRLRVVVLGERHDSSVIGLVTDLHTGRVDGSVSPGKPIRIEGRNIKVFPDGDVDCGVFFVPVSGVNPVRASERLYTNNPKLVEVEVPVLAPGSYLLRIVTRYASGGAVLHSLRVIDFGVDLVVGGGGGDPGRSVDGFGG